MKIVAVMTMKNESDVLESWLRYYSNLVDQVLVLDNLSTDNSCEIVNGLITEGLPISLYHDNRPEHVQDERMTKLMKRAVNEFDADWVLLLDADELLIPQGGEDFYACFSRLDSNKLLRVPWRTYVPTNESSSECHKNPFKRIKCRLEKEFVQYYKVMVPKSLGLHSNAWVGLGNHSLTIKRKEALFQDAPEGMFIAHFPVRSLEQLRCKILPGWLATISRAKYNKGENYHWKRLFDILSNSNMKDFDITELAISYLGWDEKTFSNTILKDDPVPESLIDYDLNFGNEFKGDILGLVCKHAEDIAIKSGQLSKDFESIKNNPLKAFGLFVESSFGFIGRKK